MLSIFLLIQRSYYYFYVTYYSAHNCIYLSIQPLNNNPHIQTYSEAFKISIGILQIKTQYLKLHLLNYISK